MHISITHPIKVIRSTEYHRMEVNRRPVAAKRQGYTTKVQPSISENESKNIVARDKFRYLLECISKNKNLVTF